ncbi:hypothetical protein [Halocatena pleomorpha]|uniref:Glycosyltransferase RgtA/B/C/D-like domain-containing protein n=1 Tax=Halocatena pleomorpha TaxID=1785090 RepID=A0A3P3RAQ9_9EURY|nr:hypothetical protein [Halocatena pleomorpha]RRJ30484.1 hypothetical protein EIK79_09365 [Halocatena pleomorpha]
MSTRPGLLGMARQGRLDIIAGLLGLLAAIAMLPLQLFLDDVYVRTLPIVLGIASLLYLIAARDEYPGDLPTLSPMLSRLLPPLIVLGSALLILLAGIQGERTLLFYDIAAALGTTLLVTILFVDRDYFSPTMLLFLVVLFGMVFRFAALYTTPGFIGIDIWTHMGNWGPAILESQSLQPISGRKYYAAPLYHLLVVGSSLLLDIPLKMALYLVLGVAMPLSVLLIYSTATFFVRKRWAVFATAIYAMSAAVIEWGIHIIPTSLGLVFFLSVFYSLDRMLRIDYKPRDFGMVVFFSVAVILTHQISAFIMLVFTGSGLLAYFALGLGLFDIGRPNWERSSTRESVNLTGLLVFDLGLITFMWSLTPQYDGTFLTVMIGYFGDTLESGSVGDLAGGTVPPSVAPQPSFMSTIIEYLDVLGFLLMLLLTIVGCYYIIRQENISHAMFTSVVATVLMLIFVFGFPMLGVRTFVPGRWFPFVAAPMAVVAAIGLSYLVNNTNPSVVVIVLLVFILAFPAASFLASDSTQESPPFSETQTRYSYTESEIAAVNVVDTYFEKNQSMWSTDQPYYTVFERTEARSDEYMQASMFKNGSVQGWVGTDATGNETLNESETIIYRDYHRKGAANFNFYYNNASTAHKPSVSFQQTCGDNMNILYSNKKVKICSQPEA